MSADHDESSGFVGAASAASASATVNARPRGRLETLPIDVLSDALRGIRLTGATFFLVEADHPWAAEAPAAPALAPALVAGARHVISYHAIVRGDCWGGLLDESPVPLTAGDMLILPQGDAYALRTQPDVRSDMPIDATLSFFRAMAVHALPPVVRASAPESHQLEIVCGFLVCDALRDSPVLTALPRLLVVRGTDPRRSERLDQLIDYAVGETRELAAGGDCVLTRIGELIFVEAVRRHLAADVQENAGWLAGLRDPVVGRALALLHARPGESWTVERLAGEVGRSRSVLAERFSALVGQPPMQYLSNWRIQLAARRLERSRVEDQCAGAGAGVRVRGSIQPRVQARDRCSTEPLARESLTGRRPAQRWAGACAIAARTASVTARVVAWPPRSGVNTRARVTVSIASMRVPAARFSPR